LGGGEDVDDDEESDDFDESAEPDDEPESELPLLAPLPSLGAGSFFFEPLP
jgi:hypothetical protein